MDERDQIANAEREANHACGNEGLSETVARFSRSVSLVCTVLATHSEEIAELKQQVALLESAIDERRDPW